MKKEKPTESKIKIIAVEEWKPAYGFEDLYEVSNLGRVRRDLKNIAGRGAKNGLVLKNIPDSCGYAQLCLRKNKGPKMVKVHKLVALTFIGERPIKHQINHINGDKMDASVSNLEYVTAKENHRHCLTVLNAGAKIKFNDILKVKELISNGIKQKEIGLMYGVCQSAVSKLKRSVRWGLV